MSAAECSNQEPKQAHMNANPFAGLNSAKTSQSGVYLSDGRYKLKISKCVYFKTEAGPYAFIAELLVTESSDPDKHPVGAARTWYQSDNKSFKPELKAFYYAATGYNERDPAQEKFIRENIEQRSEAVMQKAVTHQVLGGREITVDVNTKPQKGDPTKSFTKHVFTPASPPIPVEYLDKAIALP